MNWEAIGAVGEVLGGLGVIATLGYLAVQIRQNTRALHSSSYAQSAEQLWLVNLAIAQDRDLARMISEHSAEKPLSLEDTIRLNGALNLLFFGCENLFREYERGLLDSDTWDNVVLNVIPGLPPALFDSWRARKGPLAKRLLAHLESRNLL